MKITAKIWALAVVALLALFSSVSAEAQLFSKKSSAYTSGQTTGTALKSLYTQYQADGKKLDLKNTKNLLSLATLATNISGLKGTTKDSAFYKDFATGIIAGSTNLVTSSTSDSVMSGLTALAGMDLSAITGGTASAATASESSSQSGNLAEIAESVTGILGLLKK
ncbi:MAG: hypothetical protein ACI395_09505 [Candidatus Cryptobacteroides sp.]